MKTHKKPLKIFPWTAILSINTSRETCFQIVNDFIIFKKMWIRSELKISNQKILICNFYRKTGFFWHEEPKKDVYMLYMQWQTIKSRRLFFYYWFNSCLSHTLYEKVCGSIDMCVVEHFPNMIFFIYFWIALYSCIYKSMIIYMNTFFQFFKKWQEK